MLSKELEKLVEQFKGGDQRAFDKIYESTFKVVYFASYSILGDKSMAENITQDTYFSAFKRLNEYTTNNFLAYLVTIAKNLSFNEKKKFARNTYVDFSANEATYDTRFSNMPQENELGVVDIAKKLLSEQDFQIIIMCVVSGYKRREVADILDLPISTVSYKYKSALATIEQYLKKRGVYHE
ncbi:MAG: sigma-70 family RNA polymerase sigma factor [Clostridia bacterium]